MLGNPLVFDWEMIMSGSSKALIEGIYAAFAAGDMAAFTNALAPDIVWNEAENYPYADRNPYRGAQQIIEGVFGRTAEDWDGFAVQMNDFVDGGDRVVAMGRYSGTHKETGKKLDVQAAHVWTIENDKVVRFQQYIDTLGTARAMGAS
ncbi:SnoaL-like domain-containing protein [Altererythrobacter sp. BO-6]|uniref:nuclear transport factor 2 family protein n=1 Tax=Altererythrobacter sp. BO-6 TaxID=2604537 RepID=UPI0013E1EC2A|nr:nuclear transport factor 2 family protein [Altererythrobacter sp. BO-6]QIG53794.1 SnoaL-like domain-containing protein [Altererythrobacter sp. BO-6]